MAATARRVNKGVDDDARSSDDDNGSERLCDRATTGAATPRMCRDEGLCTPAQVAPVRRSQQKDARSSGRALAASRRSGVDNNDKNDGVDGSELGVDNGVSCAGIRNQGN